MAQHTGPPTCPLGHGQESRLRHRRGAQKQSAKAVSTAGERRGRQQQGDWGEERQHADEGPQKEGAQLEKQNKTNKQTTTTTKNSPTSPICWNGSGAQTLRLMRAGTPSFTGKTAPPHLLRDSMLLLSGPRPTEHEGSSVTGNLGSPWAVRSTCHPPQQTAGPAACPHRRPPARPSSRPPARPPANQPPHSRRQLWGFRSLQNPADSEWIPASGFQDSSRPRRPRPLLSCTDALALSCYAQTQPSAAECN